MSMFLPLQTPCPGNHGASREVPSSLKRHSNTAGHLTHERAGFYITGPFSPSYESHERVRRRVLFGRCSTYQGSERKTRRTRIGPCSLVRSVKSIPRRIGSARAVAAAVGELALSQEIFRHFDTGCCSARMHRRLQLMLRETTPRDSLFRSTLRDHGSVR